MKSLLVIAVVVALGGCAAGPPVQQRYAQPADPGQWRVVSVTPVPTGTGARVAAESKDGTPVEYSSVPVSRSPVYVPAPIYAPAPVYYPEPEYYWPPVSLSLGFVFGNRWGHGRGHYHGRRR